MAKRKPKQPKVVNTTPTYEKGQELILTDEKTMMELCTIANVQDSDYILSNGVKVNFDLIRNDGRVGHCIPKTEENAQLYKAYFSHQRVTRAIPNILDTLNKWNKMNLSIEQSGAILRIERHINKIKSTLEKI